MMTRSLWWLTLVGTLGGEAACATSQATQQDQQQQAMMAAAQPPALPPPIDVQGQQQLALAASATNALPPARIDGKPIAAASLAAHQTATGLPRAEALADLIDVTLLVVPTGGRSV